MLAIETGLWVLYEIIDGELILNGPSKAMAKGMKKRKPVEQYLTRQGTLRPLYSGRHEVRTGQGRRHVGEMVGPRHHPGQYQERGVGDRPSTS